MSKTKWIMKQYWRVGAIRALTGLALGMFVLGRLYFVYVPGLADKGLLGALILGSALVLLFMFFGWLYDVRARMWSPQNQAAVERNPYRYVPDYRTIAVDYAVFYATLRTMRSIFERVNLETNFLDDSMCYFSEYYGRRTSRKDLQLALPAANEFMTRHPFTEDSDLSQPGIGFKSRLKLAFQVQMLRLTWIQSLTGLIQDVLVFGALYVTLFYFEGAEVVGRIVPLDYLVLGILVISLPLFIVLAALGWVYDKRLRIWSPDLEVKVERDPFTYIAEPRIHVMVMPLLCSVLNALKRVMRAAEIDDTEISRTLQYFREYSKLSVSRDEDMEEARKLRAAFGELFHHPKESA